MRTDNKNNEQKLKVVVSMKQRAAGRSFFRRDFLGVNMANSRNKFGVLIFRALATGPGLQAQST